VAKISKTFQYGKQTVTLETGESPARPAVPSWSSATTPWCWCTAVAPRRARRAGLLPADGRLPGEVLRRRPHPGWLLQARRPPTEKETLTSRLIDRPIRPLFPEGFRNEVQVIATVMSLNPEVDGDIPALIGARPRCRPDRRPFNGPIGAAKVGYKEWPVPAQPDRQRAQGPRSSSWSSPAPPDAVLMVESEAAELSEDVMLGAVVFGHQQMQVAINHQRAGRRSRQAEVDWAAPAATSPGRRAEGRHRRSLTEPSGARQAGAPRRHRRAEEGRDGRAGRAG
jgi:polyribonucleotide nucleotidyltransferase